MRRLIGLLCAMTAVQAAAAGTLRFAAIGDTPYFAFEEPAFAATMRQLDDETLDFIVHVGDFKSGATPCTDALYAERRAQFDASRHPLVYTPGDNEWTDCHRAAAGGYDPVERLSALRLHFFPAGQTLGQRRLAVERQSADAASSAMAENARWEAGGVVFVTLNVPGSNNNLGRTPVMDSEHAGRMAANFAWLDAALTRAESGDAAALVIVMHGDPRVGADGRNRRPDGYAALRAVLAAQAQWLAKPVLLVHGDGHRFRVDQPLADPATGMPIANFTRVETFGSPAAAPGFSEADPLRPGVFTIGTGRTYSPPP